MIVGRVFASPLGYSGCRYAGRVLASGTPRRRDLVAHAGDDTPVARWLGFVEVAPCGGWRRWGETGESRLVSAKALTLDMPASPSVQQEVKHGRTKPAGVAHPCLVKLSFRRLPALDSASSLRT